MVAARGSKVRSAAEASSSPPAFDFDTVYRANVAYVWHTLQRLGMRQSELEDLAQDVFAVAYRRRDGFDRELPIRPWLFGIAFRVASDARRRASRREMASEEQDIVDPAPALDHVASQRRLCLAGLGELSLNQRAVLIMHDLDGYTAPEIAASLKLPLNTVYSRLRIARARFVLVARRLSGQET